MTSRKHRHGEPSELGAAVLVAVREDDAFAHTCFEWLKRRQEPDELIRGTSLHRNARGFDKYHARAVHAKDLDDGEIKAMVSEYAHTQLAEGVRDGELTLPRRRRKRRTVEESDDEPDDADDALVVARTPADHAEHDEEEEETNAPVALDLYGVTCERLPSRAFGQRALQIAAGLSCDVLRIPDEVTAAVNAQDAWSGAVVSPALVDAALYCALPPIDYATAKEVRIFWANENLWASARVESVARGDGGRVSVELSFPDEGCAGSVSGADALYAYDLRVAARFARCARGRTETRSTRAVNH